jgi:hypothetical protein
MRPLVFETLCVPPVIGDGHEGRTWHRPTPSLCSIEKGDSEVNGAMLGDQPRGL